MNHTVAPSSPPATTPRLAAAAALALGGGGLVAHLLASHRLVALPRAIAGTDAGTAVVIVLSALALWLGRDAGAWRRAITAACAALVVLAGLGTLAGAVLGAEEGTAPLTALGSVLLGLALGLLFQARTAAAGQWLALATGYLGVINLAGHAYRLEGLAGSYSPASAYADMALPTAAAFVVLGAGALAARPDRGMMAVVTSDTAGGSVARRLLPATLGLPLVVAWLRLVGEQAGLWSFHAGLALLFAATLVLFVAIVWRSARALYRADVERRRLILALERAHDRLESQVERRTRDLTDTVGALEGEVAERHRAEEALRESERLYRDLVELSRGLICAHDLDGRLLSVNPAAARLLGYTPTELVGRSLREILAPSVRGDFAAYLERIRRAPTDAGVMRVATRQGDERVWAYSNVRHEEPGRAPFVLGHAQDITDLRRTEALAREAEGLRAVADLANAAAHEINNPLTVVMGHLQILKMRSRNDPDALDRIEKAVTGADRIRDIVWKMVRITRLERVSGAGLPSMLDLSHSDPAGGRTSPDRESA